MNACAVAGWIKQSLAVASSECSGYTLGIEQERIIGIRQEMCFNRNTNKKLNIKCTAWFCCCCCLDLCFDFTLGLRVHIRTTIPQDKTKNCMSARFQLFSHNFKGAEYEPRRRGCYVSAKFPPQLQVQNSTENWNKLKNFGF